MSDDARQALYRETQLVLRALVGARELDGFLADKDGVVQELEQGVRRRVAAIGLEVVTVGIRDIILPGEMKDLLNKVTEAKKAAEANLIVRREETAAMRSQANTAKLLQDNPTLMRLRELEVLEKVAAIGQAERRARRQGIDRARRECAVTQSLGAGMAVLRGFCYVEIDFPRSEPMTLTIHLPQTTLERIQAEAKASGKDVEAFVLQAVEAQLARRRRTLAEVLAPIHDAVEASGLDEVAVTALLEKELKVDRAERRLSGACFHHY